jgi:hypothetical protein
MTSALPEWARDPVERRRMALDAGCDPMTLVRYARGGPITSPTPDAH